MTLAGSTEHWLALLSRHQPRLWLAGRMTTAALITFVIASALSLPQGFWAVLTSVIVTQASVGGSIKAAIERLGGSICGAGVGAAIALAIPHRTPILLGVALVVATAPMAGLAAFAPGFRIAPVTAIIVLLSGTAASLGPFGYASARVFEIALGSVVGVVISTVMRPAHAHDLVLGTAAEVASILALELKELSHAGGAEAPDLQAMQTKSRKLLTRLEVLTEEAARERRSHMSSEPDPEPIFRTLRRLRQDISSLNRAFREPWPGAIHQQLTGPWSKLAGTAAHALEELARALPARKAPNAPNSFSQAVTDYFAAVEEVRRKGLTQHLPAEIVGRIFGVVFVIEQFSGNLGDMMDRAGESARSN